MAPADATIARFLAAVAAPEPAPGAGATGAVALALGIACARKAIAITLKHRADAPVAAAAARLASLSDQALAGADADARCFAAYIAATQAGAPHRDALETLIAVGENVAALCDEARAAIDGIAAHIHASMANDIGAARTLVAAARSIHTACVAESRRGLRA